MIRSAKDKQCEVNISGLVVLENLSYTEYTEHSFRGFAILLSPVLFSFIHHFTSGTEL